MINLENKTKPKQSFTDFLSRRYQLITGLLVLAIIVAGSYLLLFKYQRIRSENGNNRQLLEQKKKSQVSYLRDLEELIDNYQKINQRDVEILNQILPQEKDIPGLFVQLQNIAASSGFSLLAININEEPQKVVKDKEGEKIKKLNVSLNLSGRNYVGLKRFLAAAESNLRLFDVNAVYFNPDTNSYSVNFFTYYFSD